MDEGDCRKRQGGQHGADDLGGTGNGGAMLGPTCHAMENGEGTYARRPGRIVASLAETPLIWIVEWNR